MDFDWINRHIDYDTSRLRLKYGSEHVDDILQIEMRKKHGAKFDEILRRNPHFIFPNSLAAEQSTSWHLADFHTSLISDGDRVADLTAGLGIDAMAFAGKASLVVAIERSQEVADALSANSSEIHNLEVITADCRDIISKWVAENVQFDTIFIDPARRSRTGGRVYALADCEPDVVKLLTELRKITPRLIIKASPMLDITHTVREVENVGEAIVIGTSTECKELCICCNFSKETSDPIIRAVTVGNDGISEFDFTKSEESEAKAVYGIPEAGDFILDPYPAVMKAAPNKLLGQRFGINKLGANTHLWFSHNHIASFPGQAFRIIEILPYMSKHIKRYSSRYPRVAVTARNFNISSDSLRAKLNVKDGPLRLFAVNVFDGRNFLITCEKT